MTFFIAFYQVCDFEQERPTTVMNRNESALW